MFEGGEGSGKSTQVQLMAARLRSSYDTEVVVTFEPGATARGALLRKFLLDDDSPLEPRAELLLMAADRAQHCGEVVGPALARGAVVLCDRFEPSSLAYQGVGRGLGVETVELVSGVARGPVTPDLVIVLDVSDTIAARRRPTADDRIEQAGDEFHARVRAAYRDLAATRGWNVIDASGTVDNVHASVWEAVSKAIDRP